MARKMRDSGVEWIGEVPEGWDTLRFSQSIDRISTGLNPRDNFKLSKEDPLYYVTIRNFKNGVLYLDEKCDRISYDAWRIIQDRSDLSSGDILFASISDTPQAYLIEEEPRSWNINESVFTIRVAVCHFNPRYFYYQITADPYYESLLLDATGSTFKSIKQHKLLQSFMVKPPLPEQRRIADYLDEKCAAIDGAVEELKCGIEDCKAWKKAIIFEAVTGKANVLAASACAIRRRNCYGGQVATADKKSAKVAKRQMRDSGIPWIGEIPEGWEVYKLKRYTSMLTPMRDKPVDLSGDVPWVRIEDYDGKYISCSKAGYGVSESTIRDMNLKVYPVGTVLCTSSCDLGKCAIVKRELVSNQRFIGIIPNENTCSDFLYYLMLSNADRLNHLSRGTIQANLSRVEFEQMMVQMPPLPEQQAIADYLDEKCAAIDALVAEKEELIADLEAYKKSLIFELVTGKVEVK